ncbi:MAG: serine hydrolase, partial [Bacteroidia bacterium]|nr:serine hydrolase [Bacteroidia bacterium]
NDSFVFTYQPTGSDLSQGCNTNTKQVSILDAADLKSSARDMHAFLTAVYVAMELQNNGGELNTLQQALAMTTDVWIPGSSVLPPTMSGMGLAWQINKSNVLNKNGDTDQGGSSCNVLLTKYNDSSQPVGIALMTNQDGARPDKTAATIVNEILGLME